MLPTGELQYNAQSPDEAALVGAAKNFGFVFKVSNLGMKHCDLLVHMCSFRTKVRTPFIIQLLNLHTGNEVRS